MNNNIEERRPDSEWRELGMTGDNRLIVSTSGDLRVETADQTVTLLLNEDGQIELLVDGISQVTVTDTSILDLGEVDQDSLDADIRDRVNHLIEYINQYGGSFIIMLEIRRLITG